MLKFLALFLSLSVGLHASCASGTLGFYTLTVDGSEYCGGTPLTQNGTVPFTTIGGNLCAGPFTDANYWTTSAAICSSLQGATAYTFECYVYFTSLGAAQTIMGDQDNGSPNAFRIQVLTTGSLRYVANSTFKDTATGVIVINTWYNLAITWNNTNRKIWVNNAVSASDSSSGTLPSVSSLAIGRNLGFAGEFVRGYIYGARFSSVALTSFPTVDNVSLKAIVSGSNIQKGSNVRAGSLVQAGGLQ